MELNIYLFLHKMSSQQSDTNKTNRFRKKYIHEEDDFYESELVGP